MWNTSNTNIQMTRGDFGIALPITISGATLTDSDSVRMTIRKQTTTVLEKVMTPVNNTVELVLTEAESDALQPGNFAYSLDWYQDGVFMCNLVANGIFAVVNK